MTSLDVSHITSVYNEVGLLKCLAFSIVVGFLSLSLIIINGDFFHKTLKIGVADIYPEFIT